MKLTVLPYPLIYRSSFVPSQCPQCVESLCSYGALEVLEDGGGGGRGWPGVDQWCPPPLTAQRSIVEIKNATRADKIVEMLVYSSPWSRYTLSHVSVVSTLTYCRSAGRPEIERFGTLSREIVQF